MSGGTHIRAIEPENAGTNPAGATDQGQEPESPPAPDDHWEESWDEAEPLARSGWLHRALPVSAVVAVIGWTAFFGWAHQGQILTGTSAQQGAALVVNWAIPVILIVALWLLAMRNSRREAMRFGEVAGLLNREAAALEERLAIVNRELSLAREFLGTQSRELDSLGRIASERLATHAGKLQELIHHNGAQVDAIATVSASALGNMERLRGDLPVIANSAKDVSSQIGNAGNTAQEQVDKLISGFERLNQFGQASGRQVDALASKVDATLAGFEAQVERLDQVAGARFDALRDRSEDYRADLDRREVDALAAMHHRADELREGLTALQSDFAAEEGAAQAAMQARLATLRSESDHLSASLRKAEAAALAAMRESKDRLHDDIAAVIQRLDEIDRQAMEASKLRVTALNEEANHFDDRLREREARFTEEFARRQDAFETREAQAGETLAQRLADLDDAIAARTEAQIESLAQLVEHGEAVSGRVSALQAALVEVSEQAELTSGTVDGSIAGLAERLECGRDALDVTGQSLERLTQASVRLLEIIQSGARQTRDELPVAIEDAETRIAALNQTAGELGDALIASSATGSELSSYVIASRDNALATGKELEGLHSSLYAQHAASKAQLDELGETLRLLDAQAVTVSERTRGDLAAAIATLEQAIASAFATVQEETGAKVLSLAEDIGGKASEAVDRAMRQHSAEAIGRLEQAAAHAAGVGREAAIQLRDQLGKVNELAGNLEQRVARARELAEEQVDHDFARRVALITERLNSNAIDIAKVLSTDVSDTAWASYLKGDRGIFTRKAVRLLENSQARAIADIYGRDDDFREHLNRYIHDFEAMLRMLLSTRDGNSVAVTLLSSDMGKLYVALAQAIERLRS